MSKLKNICKKAISAGHEYHKKLLSFIVFNSVVMMYLSYVLAWFGKTDIAEELSRTIVTAVIGVVIPYLASKTIENISKYGCRLNGTAIDENKSVGYDETL